MDNSPAKGDNAAVGNNRWLTVLSPEVTRSAGSELSPTGGTIHTVSFNFSLVTIVWL